MEEEWYIMSKTIKQHNILLNAKSVFLEKGFFKTIMEDIAEASSITRRTLYRYFETKEEIAHEVTRLIMEEVNGFAYDLSLQLEGSGLSQLETFLYGFINFMDSKIEIMNYLGEFDFYFKDDNYLTGLFLDNQTYNDTLSATDHIILDLIQKGIEDGSIKKTINAQLVEATISQVLWSFGQKIANRGNSIKKETHFSGIEMIKNQVQLYIMALEN